MKLNGKQIAEYVANGHTVQAVKCADATHSRAILQFRLVDPEGGFFVITEFQAIKYLSESALAKVALYKKILVGRNEQHFGRRVEFNTYAKSMFNDPEFAAAFRDTGMTCKTTLV